MLTQDNRLITVFFLAMAIFGFSTACVTTNSRTSDALRNAKQYSNELGLHPQGYSCSGADSDEDGYVSCTLSFENGSTKSIECGYDKPFALLGQNTGCKVKLVPVQAQSN